MTSYHSSSEAAVKRMLAERTGTDAAHWHLVFKARYGMLVLFRELAAAHGPGDVITQTFTCSTAVDPILEAGLRPVYAEVSPATIALDPKKVHVTNNTRAVVIQNTFGIICPITAELLRDQARHVGAAVVEDSAHCVGRMARDHAGRPLADISIHSFGVEKMLPTRFGGAVWINPAWAGQPDQRDQPTRQGQEVTARTSNTATRVSATLTALPPMDRRLDLVTRLYRTQIRVLNRLPTPLAHPVRNALTAVGAFEPAVAPAEGRGVLPYGPMRPSPWITDQILEHLPTLTANDAQRAAAVTEYLHRLGDHVQIPAAISENSALVRFPFFARDHAQAEQIIAALQSAGFYPGRWYRPALFPGVQDPARYGYTPGSLPVTEDLIERAVNLPTRVEAPTARRIADVVLTVGGVSRT